MQISHKNEDPSFQFPTDPINNKKPYATSRLSHALSSKIIQLQKNVETVSKQALSKVANFFDVNRKKITYTVQTVGNFLNNIQSILQEKISQITSKLNIIPSKQKKELSVEEQGIY